MGDIFLKIGTLSCKPFALLRAFFISTSALSRRPWLLTNQEKEILGNLNMMRTLGMELINERLGKFEENEKLGNNDFLQIYLRAFKEGKIENNTKEEILQNFITFYVAG